MAKKPFRMRLVCGAFAVLAIVIGFGEKSASARIATIVVDTRTGSTLQNREADALRYPASLTKMMTLYLAFDDIDRGRLRLSQRLRVSAHAASMPATKLGLRKGQYITVRDAILALVTCSANDAAVVLAEAMSGSERSFARRMTAKARSLGLMKTTFRNASGLHHPQQRTTPREMAKLVASLQRAHPRNYRYFSTRTFRYRGAIYANHNRLLGVYRGMDGVKTGYTGKAGYNLAASAKRGGTRLIGVVMGAPSISTRNRLMVRLLDAGFANPAVQVAAKRKRHSRSYQTVRFRTPAARPTTYARRGNQGIEGSEARLSPPTARPLRRMVGPAG